MKYLYLPLVLILVGCISSNSPTEGDFLKREGNGMYYAHKPMLMEINSVPPPFDIGGNFPYVLWINGKRVPYAPMKELSAVVAKVGEDKIKDIDYADIHKGWLYPHLGPPPHELDEIPDRTRSVRAGKATHER